MRTRISFGSRENTGTFHFDSAETMPVKLAFLAGESNWREAQAFEHAHGNRKVPAIAIDYRDAQAVCGVFCELVSSNYPVTGKNTGKFFKIFLLIEGLPP